MEGFNLGTFQRALTGSKKVNELARLNYLCSQFLRQSEEGCTTTLNAYFLLRLILRRQEPINY